MAVRTVGRSPYARLTGVALVILPDHLPDLLRTPLLTSIERGMQSEDDVRERAGAGWPTACEASVGALWPGGGARSGRSGSAEGETHVV